MNSLKTFMLLGLLTCCILGLTTAGNGAVPGYINYQGFLTDTVGNPMNGTFSMDFKLYSQPVGGPAIWSILDVVTIINLGLFSAQLDSFPDTVNNSPTIYLGITVGDDQEMVPRIQISSVPYAHRIGTINNARGGFIDGSIIVGGKANLGQNNDNSATSAFVIGTLDTARGPYSSVLGGRNNAAYDSFCVVTGGENNRAGNDSLNQLSWSSGDRAWCGGGYNNYASGSYSAVCGGQNNYALGEYSFLGGGQLNDATGTESVVGGGSDHTASGGNSVIGGGEQNTASGDKSIVGGGRENTAQGDYSIVGGGWVNDASAAYSTIGGGQSNGASGDNSVISGGSNNDAYSDFSTIGGGFSNTTYNATSEGATIGGGYDNQASDDYATVGGGLQNYATALRSTVGGGGFNTAEGDYSTVSGGTGNTASGVSSTVSGGSTNEATGHTAAIGGGSHNTAEGGGATVAGGRDNYATADTSTIGGGAYNEALGLYSTIGGGLNNTASGQRATVAGGGTNTVNSGWGFIGGGTLNTVSSNYGTIGGGWTNSLTAPGSCTIAGGYLNSVSGVRGAIGGGYSNVVSDSAGTVSGGHDNEASGRYATVPGGQDNSAIALHSFAAGKRAKANHQGAFVWGSTNDATEETRSFSTYTFTARCANGARFYSTQTGIGTGVELSAGGGMWNALCDSTKKRNIRPVETGDILRKIVNLPINRWSYKSQDPSIEHIGPMAQDFYTSFHLGDSETTIGELDPSGVALAAIQELAKQNESLQAANDKLTAELASQATRYEALTTRLSRMETILTQIASSQLSVLTSGVQSTTLHGNLKGATDVTIVP